MPHFDVVTAIALALLVYAALALACLGWGFAAARVLRITTDVMTLAWLGFAVVLLIFQVLHLAVALTAFAAAPVFLIGIAFAIPRVSELRIGPVLAALPAAAWIAARSMLVPEVYDTGLYHLATIRWINSFPIVPGLGNLHGRLAFNQAFFPFAASIEAIAANGARLANGFLLLLAAATFIARLRVDLLPSLFALPILLHLALLSPGLASPTPDFASFLLQLVMFTMLLRGDKTVLAVLAATAITIKLSNLAFATVVLAIVVRSKRVAAIVAVVLAVWMARGLVLSGAPLYPSTLGYVAFDWSVPRGEVEAMATQIRGFARRPDAGWSTAIGNWNWLPEWSRRLEKTPVIAPIVLGAFLLIAAAWKGFPRKESVILLPVLAGLVYWFFAAPDPRFAHALFFCFAIGAALLFFTSVQTHRRYAWIVCVVFAIANAGLALQVIRHWREITRVSIGWQPIPRVALIQRTTASGLIVFVPAEGEKCWNAPLPCTPYFREDLRAREPGDLSSGFGLRSKKITTPLRCMRAESSGTARDRVAVRAPQIRGAVPPRARRSSTRRGIRA